MQMRRKKVLYRWIAFLMRAACGVFLTGAIANRLATGQFHYLTAFDKIRDFIEFANDFSFLVAGLWVCLAVAFEVAITKLGLSFTTGVGLSCLFATAPVYALILVYFYCTGEEMPFSWQLLLWLGIMNVLWLSSRFIEWFYDCSHHRRVMKK